MSVRVQWITTSGGVRLYAAYCYECDAYVNGGYFLSDEAHMHARHHAEFHEARRRSAESYTFSVNANATSMNNAIRRAAEVNGSAQRWGNWDEMVAYVGTNTGSEL